MRDLKHKTVHPCQPVLELFKVKVNLNGCKKVRVKQYKKQCKNTLHLEYEI